MMADLFRPETIPQARPIDRPDSDFYVTLPEYITALVARQTGSWRSIYRDHEGPLFWEPACGDGAIARVLERQGLRVIATDLIDQGFGQAGVDFLKTDKLLAPIVITNPPYRDDLPLRFAQHALALGACEVWLLCRAAWWDAPKRFRTLKEMPLRHRWVVNTRKAMWPYGRVPPGKERSTWMYYHAWFGFIAGRATYPEVAVIEPAMELVEDRLPL